MGIEKITKEIKRKLGISTLPSQEELWQIQDQAPEGVSVVETANGRTVLSVYVVHHDEPPINGKVQKSGFTEILKTDANLQSAHILAEQIYHKMKANVPANTEKKKLRNNWLDTKAKETLYGKPPKRD